MKLRLIRGIGVLLTASLVALGGDMETALRSGDLWKKSRRELAADVLNGVRYAPVDAHSYRIPSNGGLALGKLRFGDVLVTQDEEGLISHMEIIVYSKGDNGAISQEEYEKLLEESVEALTSALGVEGEKVRVSRTQSKKQERESGVKLETWRWNWENGVAQLEASATGGTKMTSKKKLRKRGGLSENAFSAEFIRLKMGSTPESIEKGGAKDAVKRTDLKANVKKEGTAVWIDGVNMVDQGQKGYCVPATVARVFAYYGMDGVDQHALAQLCSSSGEGGTSTRAMQEALENISRTFKFKVVAIDGSGALDSLVTDYNNAAKKLKKPQQMGYNVGSMNFDPEVMKAARGTKGHVKKWLSPIKKSIAAGQPVLWSVILGIFPESGIPQTGGGHMRLIIGYDEKENIIYYSDSWGAGHERKQMAADQAASITTGRFLLKK